MHTHTHTDSPAICLGLPRRPTADGHLTDAGSQFDDFAFLTPQNCKHKVYSFINFLFFFFLNGSVGSKVTANTIDWFFCHNQVMHMFIEPPVRSGQLTCSK